MTLYGCILFALYIGRLEESLAIGDFPPGDHSLDIIVIDVHGQSVTHPTLTFTRPPLPDVQCSVHNSQTIDCASFNAVESQMCSIDDGLQFNCSLPHDISELATTYNLKAGDYNLIIRVLDEFGQFDTTLIPFTVFRKLILTHNYSDIYSVFILKLHQLPTSKNFFNA